MRRHCAVCWPAASVLHVDPPSQCRLEWLPGPADFLDALRAQGYDAGRAASTAPPADGQQAAPAEPVPAPRLHALALLLRLLRMVLGAQVLCLLSVACMQAAAQERPVTGAAP